MVLEYKHLQNCVIFGANVGKYSSTMEHMGCLLNGLVLLPWPSFMWRGVQIEKRQQKSDGISTRNKQSICGLKFGQSEWAVGSPIFG